MSGFLNSLKSDLFDRRMLPVLVVLAAALAGALVFAFSSGGGSSASTPAPAPSASVSPPGATGGIAVTPAETGANKAVAETTDGAPAHPNNIRNPFKSPASAQSSSTSSPGSSSGSSSGSSGASSSQSESSGGGSSSSGSSGSGGSSSQSSKPKSKQPQTVYHVSVLVGLAPAGAAEAPPPAKLDNLKRLTPLPSNSTPLVVFAGVTSGGKSATFQVVGEVIPRGPGVCIPSPSQCEAFALKPGQTEQLENLPLNGTPAVYQLQLLSITSSKASSAKAATASFHVSSVAGRSFLRRAGLAGLPGLRYSLDAGVLVPVAAHAALAHTAHRAHTAHGH